MRLKKKRNAANLNREHMVFLTKRMVYKNSNFCYYEKKLCVAQPAL